MFFAKSGKIRPHTSSCIYRLGRTACDLVALTYLAVTVVFPAQSLRITLIESAWAQSSGQHNQKPEDCPEGLGPPQNCNDIERMAAILAEKRGWGVQGGRAAFRSRGYQVNVHDCTTGNAQMGCLINDPCMAQHGEMKMLRSQSAWHATSYWQGANGQSFECDFTPGTGYGGGTGNLIGNRGDARIGTSTIDGGESPDPNYALNNCPSAGSGNYSAFGGGGGSGGMSSMMNLMMLMSLLQSLQQQNQQQQNQQQPTVAPIDIVPTATPTPTPTPAPTPAAKVKISAGALSDSELVGGRELKPEIVVQSSSLDLPAAVSTDKANKKSAQWEDPRGSMF